MKLFFSLSYGFTLSIPPLFVNLSASPFCNGRASHELFSFPCLSLLNSLSIPPGRGLFWISLTQHSPLSQPVNFSLSSSFYYFVVFIPHSLSANFALWIPCLCPFLPLHSQQFLSIAPQPSQWSQGKSVYAAALFPPIFSPPCRRSTRHASLYADAEKCVQLWLKNF